jgi:hypothetical protein
MMHPVANEDATRTRMPAWMLRAGVLATLLFAMVAAASAQTINGDLSGIVVDGFGARVTKARVTLQNDKTKDVRNAVTNREGIYQFIAVPTGTYTLTVKATSFSTYQETEIDIHPGDQRALPDIKLAVGDEQVITVSTANSDIIESGEQSALISKEDISHLAIEGRDVTELVKILPGFAINATGSTGISNSSGNAVGVTLSGLADNYAANGSPEGGVGLVSDGANVQDPGSPGAGAQTINMDMVEEVKVQTSNFGAESAKGPIVINAVGKSGGATYHGSVYIIGNASQLNSQDWLTNFFALPKPDDRYMYPGGQIGGPVKIPGTNFNSAKKLTFIVNGEEYIQKNVFAGGTASNALRLSTVPSDRMRAGDYSTAALAQWLNVPLDARGLLTGCNTTIAADISKLTNFGAVCSQAVGVDAKGVAITNGIIQNYDPGGEAYLNIFPHANRTPQPVQGGNITDGYDRTDLYLFDNDLYQARGRLDYAVSDTTKIFGVYNYEAGKGFTPSAIFYTSGNVLRNPTLNVGNVTSQSGSLNFTKVIGATMTNELVAAGLLANHPYTAQNESLNLSSTLGYPYGGIVQSGSKQIPQLGYSSGNIPQYNGPDYSFGPIFTRKQSLDVGDTYTWVLRSHTLKAGVYAERLANNQINTVATQGSLAEFGSYASGHIIPAGAPAGTAPVALNPNNILAQLFLGFVNSYQQYTSEPLLDMHYNIFDGFVSDAWKATKSITLTYGVRFEHLGPWADSRGLGLAVWNPQNYVAPNYTSAISYTSLPGISWHGINSALPLSGNAGRAVFPSPRLGFSNDIYGNGKTVLGGGFGLYRSHDSWNDDQAALATAKGSYADSVNNTTLHCADAIGKGLVTTASTAVGGAYADCTGISVSTGSSSILYGDSAQTAVAANDTQQPVSYTYSLAVTQQFLKKSQLKIGYAGSENAHILVRGALQNINTVPFGALFGPDPNPNSPYYGQIAAPDSVAQVSDFRPYPFYASLDVLRHSMHTNYNSLQTTWTRQTGHLLFNLNYTWSRAEGDLASTGHTVPDATNKRNDRGILNFDRTNIFNASYTFIGGTLSHRNRFLGGLVNGWEFSGITNMQSGPNLQSASSVNFNLQSVSVNSQTFAQTPIAGVPMIQTDNKTWLGTPDIFLQPATTCAPQQNLKARQYVNASCLVLPALGTNGPFRLPYLRGPGYFNSDISAQKSWRLGDKQNFQIRFAGFNFANHPLNALVAAGTATPLQLTLSPTAQSTGFGNAIYKQGRRVVEVTLRYNF